MSGRDRSARGWIEHVGLVLLLVTVPIVTSTVQRVDRPAAAIGAIALSLLLSAGWLLAWRRTGARRGTDAAFAMAFLAVVALWRHAEGGASSGYGPLVLGPLLFLALRASRRALLLGVAGVAATFVLPLLLLDPAMYPAAQELRRAIVWTVAGLVSGLAVHRLVQRAEVARRTTELVLQRMPGTVVVLFDRHLRFSAVHGRGAGTDAGVPWPELVGLTPADLFGERAEAFEARLRRTRDGAPQEFEWTSTDGAHTHLVATSPWRATGEHDPNVGVIVVRDISDRVQMEHELAQERGFLRALVESLHEGVMALDRDGRIRLVNEALGSMLGLAKETIASGDDDDLARELRLYDAVGQVIATHEMPLPRTLAGEVVTDEPFTVTRVEGGSRELEMSGTQIRDPDDTMLGAVFTVRDVTAQREVERMKDQFFAMVSHELRTPLAAIVGYLELLEDEEQKRLSEGGREFVSVMQRNAQRLMRLIGDLLFAAQVEAGTLALVHTDVDLAAVAREAWESAVVRARGREQQLELVVEPADVAMPWHGDRDRIGQVLDNLLGNAIKFTPEGGRIELRLLRGDGRYLLEVQDDGRGIPPDEQGRLFERFARARSAEVDVVAGVGLGLAITRAIVEAHGGTIALASEVGVGTTFSVELPDRTAEPAGNRDG